jgi:hypothetical protein
MTSRPAFSAETGVTEHCWSLLGIIERQAIHGGTFGSVRDDHHPGDSE